MESELMRDPAVIAGIIKRLESWTPRFPAGYYPGWPVPQKADERAGLRAFEIERRTLVAALRALAPGKMS